LFLALQYRGKLQSHSLERLLPKSKLSRRCKDS